MNRIDRILPKLFPLISALIIVTIISLATYKLFDFDVAWYIALSMIIALGLIAASMFTYMILVCVVSMLRGYNK